MKPAALLAALFLLIGTAAFTQWRLLPQIGIDRSNTELSINGIDDALPLQGESFFKAALRTDYHFKGGHGPYFSLGTSPSATGVSFNNPENIVNSFSQATSALQFRLEGGYGLTTKPIYFKKGASKNTAAKSTPSYTTKTVVVKKSCGSYTYTYQCQKKVPQKTEQNTAFNMRIQPAIGMAYLPGVKDDITQDGASYLYRAGNWNTGLVSTLGFELAKGPKSFMTINLSYTKGLGNLETSSLTTVADAKTTVTSFRSEASAWSLTAGVPINFSKKKTAAVKTEPKKETEKCKSYYKRCGRTVI